MSARAARGASGDSPRGRADRAGQHAGIVVAEQVAARPRRDGGDDAVAVDGVGEHDDVRGGRAGEDRLDEAIHVVCGHVPGPLDPIDGHGDQLAAVDELGVELPPSDRPER